MKHPVLLVLLALLIAITGGLLITRFMVDEVDIIFIEWENETFVGGSFSNGDADQKTILEDLSSTTAPLVDLKGNSADSKTVGKAWIFFDEEDIATINRFWASGVVKTFVTSLAVGVTFAVVTCLAIFAIVRARRTCSSGYGRLDEAEAVEAGGSRGKKLKEDVAATKWKWSTWLLIGCAAAIVGSSVTTATLVVSQILRIRSEGLL